MKRPSKFNPDCSKLLKVVPQQLPRDTPYLIRFRVESEDPSVFKIIRETFCKPGITNRHGFAQRMYGLVGAINKLHKEVLEEKKIFSETQVKIIFNQSFAVCHSDPQTFAFESEVAKKIETDLLKLHPPLYKLPVLKELRSDKFYNSLKKELDANVEKYNLNFFYRIYNNSNERLLHTPIRIYKYKNFIETFDQDGYGKGKIEGYHLHNEVYRPKLQ